MLSYSMYVCMYMLPFWTMLEHEHYMFTHNYFSSNKMGPNKCFTPAYIACTRMYFGQIHIELYLYIHRNVYGWIGGGELDWSTCPHTHILWLADCVVNIQINIRLELPGIRSNYSYADYLYAHSRRCRLTLFVNFRLNIYIDSGALRTVRTLQL